MKKVSSVQKMTSAALLIAVGIVIPLFSPIKIILEPAASFTLASHVAIFIGMFMSPAIGVSVAAGTTLGFLLAGFPPVVVVRAATHLVFAFVGGLWLRRHPATLASAGKTVAFSFTLGVLHALCEVVASTAFYFGGIMGDAVYNRGFLWSILVLVGVGTIVHSMIDFGLAALIVRALASQKPLAPLFAGTPYAPANAVQGQAAV